MTKRESELVNEVKILRNELDNMREEENKLLISKSKTVDQQAVEIARLENLLKQKTDELKIALISSKSIGESDGVLVAEISILKRQVNEKNKKLEDMKDELKLKTAEIEGLKKRVVIESKRIDTNHAEALSHSATLTQENIKLKEQLSKAKKAVEDNENKVFELQAEVSVQASKLKSYKDRLEVESSSTGLRSQITELQSKNAELRQRLIETDKEREHYKEKATQIESTESDLRAQLAEKDRILTTNSDIINQLEKKIDLLQKGHPQGTAPSNKDIDHLRLLLGQRIEDMKILESENETLKSENRVLYTKLASLKQKVAMIHQEVKVTQNQQGTGNFGSNGMSVDWRKAPGIIQPGSFDKKFGFLPEGTGNLEENKRMTESMERSNGDHDEDSSFNRAMARANGDNLQAGLTPSNSQSQVGQQQAGLNEPDRTDINIDVKLDEINKFLSSMRVPNLESHSKTSELKDSCQMTQTVKGSNISSSADQFSSNTLHRESPGSTQYGMGDRIVGRMSSLEELIKVQERENLLLVRKFEASRREVAEITNQCDQLNSQIRECKLREDELLNSIEAYKEKVTQREKLFNKLEFERDKLAKENEIYLARLRQEEEMGSGVTRDREWHEALFRLNQEQQNKDLEIMRLKEDKAMLADHIESLQSEIDRAREMENKNMSLKLKLEDLEQRVILAEREANHYQDQLKRLAKNQVLTEIEEQNSSNKMMATLTQEKQALEHRSVV